MATLTGPLGYPCPTTATVGSSDPKIALGTIARDGAGNEYVWVDFQEAAIKGEIQAISSTYTAAAATAAGVGPVGIVVADSVTSDSCGWLQVYGRGSALGSTLLVIGAASIGDTTDGLCFLLPYSTTLIQCEGIYVTANSSGGSAVSSDTYSSADYSSLIGGLCSVALNYPFVSAGVHATESS